MFHQTMQPASSFGKTSNPPTRDTL